MFPLGYDCKERAWSRMHYCLRLLNPLFALVTTEEPFLSSQPIGFSRDVFHLAFECLFSRNLGLRQVVALGFFLLTFTRPGRINEMSA